VVACVSPSDVCFEESINTLRYAERTRTITNSVKQNVIKAALTPAESAALRGENKVLKTKLLEMKRRVRLLELNGGHSKDGSHRSTSLDQSQHSLDNLHATSSGDTEGSTISHGSSGSLPLMGERLDLDIAEKKTTLERLNQELSESERMLQSKGSLMEQSTEDLAHLETRMSEARATENRIARSLKSENDNLRKQNKAFMDNICSMEAETKSLVLNSVKRKTELQDEVKQVEIRRDALGHEIGRMEERLSRTWNQNSRFRSMPKSTATGGQLIELADMSSKSKSSSPVEAERLRRDLADTKLVVEASEAKLSSATTRTAELENIEKVLRKQVDELYKDQMHEREYRAQSLKDLEALMRETDKLKKERDEARIGAAFCQKEIDSLLEETETLKKERGEARREAFIREEEKVTLMAETVMLKKERDEARIKAAVHQDRKDELEESGRGRDDLITELRQELSESQHTLTKHQRSQYAPSVAAPVTRDLKDTASVTSDSVNSALTDDPVFAFRKGETTDQNSSSYKDIRVHAAKMLFYANQAIEKGRSSRSVASSVGSSIATEFKPDLRDIQISVKASAVSASGKPPRASKPGDTENQVVISNMDHVATSTNVCACQNSMFSGNAAHAEFYLPKLGMACACGKRKQETSTLDGGDPTSLSNILRPWQVEFLATLNIQNGVELVHAYNQRGGELSTAMRTWRKEQKLPSIKTKSCHVALHIWMRTSKAVVRSVRKQRAEGAKIFKKPEFLEVSSDTRTISTLGYGSVIDLKSEMMEV